MNTVSTLLIAVLISTSAWAQKAPPAAEKFECGSAAGNTIISLQFAGGRYADAFTLDLDENEMKTLLLPADQNLSLSETKIFGSFQMGSCRLGTGDVIIACKSDPTSWNMFDLSFTTFNKISQDFSQTNRTERNLQTSAFSLVVTKVGSMAHLKMSSILDNGVDHNIPFSVEPDLATLNRDWFMCGFK